MMYVTALIASVLAWLYIRSYGVVSEDAPLALVLLSALEVNGAPYVLVVMWGVFLIFGQYLHIRCSRETEDESKNRRYAMKLTSVTLALLALSNVLWMGSLLIETTRFATGVFIH